MKKMAFLLAVVVMLLLIAPASAREHEPTGDPISLRCPDPEDPDCSGTQDYAADTAFYISHGWLDMYPRLVPGHLTFELEVDGVNVPPTYVEFTRTQDPEWPQWFLNRIYFFNFPDGMTGTHTFEGHWTMPCKFVLPECEDPMAEVDWVHSTFVITFY